MRANGTNLGLIDRVGATYSGEQLRLILTELRRRVGTVETATTTTVIGGGGSGALSNEAYVTIGASAALTNERRLTGSSRISVTDAGANSTVTLDAVGAALTKTDDTNVTLTLGGAPTTALVNAASLTLGWTGQLSPTRGGTGANLSATGGTSQYVKQVTVGGAFTVGVIAAADLPSGTPLSFATPAANSVLITAPSAGSATSAIRSDATLQLSQAIAPTWTGFHAFTRATTIFGTNDEIQLDLQGLSTQTLATPVFRVKDNAGTPLRMLEVTRDGTVTVSSTTSALNGVKFQVRVPSTQSSNIMQVVRAFAGGNYTAFSIGSTGSFVLGDTGTDGPAVVRFQINQGSGQSVDMFRVRNTAGTIDLVKVDSAGVFNLAGTTSGIISFGLQAAAGTYNFNLPTGAGSAGQPLLSGGGGAAAQTYGTLGVAGGGTNNSAAYGATAIIFSDGTKLTGNATGFGYDNSSQVVNLTGGLNALVMTGGTRNAIVCTELIMTGTMDPAIATMISMGSTLRSTNTTQQQALQAQCNISPLGASLTSLFGCIFLPTISNSSTPISEVTSLLCRMDTAASFTGTIGTLTGLGVQAPVHSGSGAITTVYGVDVANMATTAATNTYGLVSRTNLASGKWNLYIIGTGDNYIAGNVSMGDTSVFNPAAKLHIRCNNSTTIGTITKAAASQSVDLAQWQNSSGTVLTAIDSSGNIAARQSVSLTSGAASTLAVLVAAVGEVASITIFYSITAKDATDGIARSGSIRASVVHKPGSTSTTGYTTNTSAVGTDSESKSDATDSLSLSFTFSNGTNQTTLQVTPTLTGMTASTFTMRYLIVAGSAQAVTV